MISTDANHRMSPLNGLVLAGGKSSRMGRDKGHLNWHGREQRYYLVDLLTPFCESVFISIREEQRAAIPDGYRIITDSYEERGPYAALLSAFEKNPEAAWL